MYLGISVSLSWCLRASVFLRDLCGQRVSVCVCACVSPCQCLVAGFPWLSAGLVSRCVHACRSAAVVCGVSDCPQPLFCCRVSKRNPVSATVSITVCLCPWLLRVCLCLRHSGSAYICPCVSLCLSPYVSPSTQVSPCVLLTTQATGGRVGPTGAQSCGPAHPTLALPWARLGACLQCLPQVNTKIRNARATSLTSAPCPLACPGLGWPRAP